jgi:cyclopropane fatty-acyl-phospholipid synthase-like methyltransferase
MDEHEDKVFTRLSEFYAAGKLPWDLPLPPPEVIDWLDGRPPGRALDLGCGYGRASIYMAELGWEVDGVEFVPHAAAVAAGRAREAGVAARFHIASVTDLGFLAGKYDFILDVGCVHALDEKGLARYHDHVKRLLGPGGTYLLFVRLQEEGEETAEGNGPRGISGEILKAAFMDGFELEKVEEGVTHVEGQAPWKSAWFYFQRLED